VTLGAVDWLVLVLYLGVVLAIGLVASRGAGSGDGAFFLASRRIPVFAVALSVLATSLSAATFLGAPEDAYNGDLTYLSLNIGGALGAILVAVWFIPAFYRANTPTVYGYVEQRLGSGAGKACSTMFLLGRLLASGARLYMAAIPVALVVFGGVDAQRTSLAIALVATAAALYTAAGGVAAVIWTDALQAVVLTAAAGAAMWLLLVDPATDLHTTWETLRTGVTSDGGAKLQTLDWSANLSAPYSVWSAIFGFTLLNAAAYGADQDLAQRLLTCRSARRGAASLLLAIALGAVVVGVFLLIGLLLWARDQQLGASATSDSRRLFLDFLLTNAPTGVKGLAIAGLLAAAMSSLDSALSSMGAAIVCDFVRPMEKRLGAKTPMPTAMVSRVSIIVVAVALALVAIACMGWQRASEEGLLRFALGVMVFAYAGLLGVFLTAIFTRRGNARSTFAALVGGPAVVAILQFAPVWLERNGGAWPAELRPSVGWRMLAGTLVSFGLCFMGGRGAEPLSVSDD